MKFSSHTCIALKCCNMDFLFNFSVFTLINISLTCVFTELINPPQNTAIESGQSVELSCESNISKSDMLVWSRNGGTVPICDCRSLAPQPGFSCYNTTRMSCNLVIENVTPDKAGEYQCESLFQAEEKSKAQLIVLSTPPVCRTYPTDQVTLLSSVEMSCSVTYTGSLAPVMTWFNPQGEELNSSNQGGPMSPNYVTSVTAEIPEVLSHTCKTSFTSVPPPGAGNGSPANNIPSYASTCNTPSLTVQYAPFKENITIEGLVLGEEIYVNSTLTCSAVAVPDVFFHEWTDDSDVTVSNNNTLLLDQLGHNLNYTCTACNQIGCNGLQITVDVIPVPAISEAPAESTTTPETPTTSSYGDTTIAPAPTETTTGPTFPEQTATTTSFTTAYWPTDPTVPGQCRSSPCIHGSLCFDDSHQYKCECDTGYTGQFCQLDKCLSDSPCVHGTICLKEMGSYKCDCFPGYTGFYCENRIDYCASRPCDNGATCLDTGNGYVCQCQAGYTGLQCETDINECASENCLNGGVCEDLIGGFVCNCAAGFTGKYCEYNINECASSPCVNESVCIDGVNGYTCRCLAGFTGVHCETDIDECASNPCYNEGKCEDLINEFKCECSVWHTGDRCEYERCPDPLLVHQHMDGPFFYKTWAEMQFGTGSHSSDFWYGLINFNSIIQTGHSGGLMVILTESLTNQVYFARYENFHVGTAGDNFKMTVSGFSGNAGDALGFHSGAQFSTWDIDNDLSSNNLAEVCGAFWYNSNSRANIAADNAMISFVWYPEDRYIKLDKVSMYLCRPAQYTVSV